MASGTSQFSAVLAGSGTSTFDYDAISPSNKSYTIAIHVGKYGVLTTETYVSTSITVGGTTSTFPITDFSCTLKTVGPVSPDFISGTADLGGAWTGDAASGYTVIGGGLSGYISKTLATGDYSLTVNLASGGKADTSLGFVAGIFTPGDDIVDFNNLSPDQRKSLDLGALYTSALGGNDTIILPTDTSAKMLNLNDPTGKYYLRYIMAPYNGGPGADIFDFSQKAGLSDYAGGETLNIDGGTPARNASATAPYLTPALDDTLKLPGSASDYTFTVKYATKSTATHTVVSTIPKLVQLLPVSINTANIERVTFAAPVSNPVTLYTPPNASGLGSMYGEVAELNSEVYGPNDPLHPADALASSNTSPAQNVHVGDRATARGWHEVSAMELGLTPADFGNFPGLSYSFANGFYQGQPSSLLGGLGGQEDALVLTGRLVNGTRTLAVAIRGTDEKTDFLDYASFLDNAFPKLAPLFSAVQAYVQDPSNGIQRVVVTGHSLGGGLAQLFASKLQVAAPVDVFTFGSPGAEALGAASAGSAPSQINFIHTGDPVATVVPGLTQSQVVKALFGSSVSALLPSTIPVKSRNGKDTLLTSDAKSVVKLSLAYPINLFLAEHRMPGYQTDLNKLIAYANDTASSFQNDKFAAALKAGTVYKSALPQIAVGTGTSAGGTMNVDVADKYVLGDLGADDEIIWNGAYSRLKDIDGGGAGPAASGSKQGDILKLTTGVWKWQANGDHYDLYKALAPKAPFAFVGTVRRVNTIITSYETPASLAQGRAAPAAGAAPAGTRSATASALAPFDPARLVTHLDGTPTTVQRAAAGATALAADGTSDVTYAGPGVILLANSAARAVLVYGGDVSTVSVTAGEATIVSDGSTGGTVSIDTGNTASAVIGGARAEAITGHLAGATFQGGSGDSIVTYSGTRSNYLLTTTADGSTNVSDVSGGGEDTLTNIQHVAFSDQTVDLTTTLIAAPTPSFAMTDVTAAISSTTIGEDYAGPVTYLQKQFIYTGADKVAVAAETGSVFLKGSTGDDALAASSGSNVLDGGLGSNFLVGADGSDGGTDTFYVDGRGGGVIWSTVANFHHGDAVTLWGFTAGTSTMPWTAQEGAQGYQGATIHSELGGAGTGVNASVTFAGVSLADAQSKLTTSTGSVDGNAYLQITYTG